MEEQITKLVKEITTSKNYEVISEGSSIEVIFKTTKYLYPIDIKNNRQHTILLHFYKGNQHDFTRACHALKLAKDLKGMKETSMPLHTFIREVHAFFDMSISLVCYGYGKDAKYFLERDTYNLPQDIKECIYNYTKSVISNIKYGVYTDNEGCSYNSVELVHCN
jgi:hypothetical protein